MYRQVYNKEFCIDTIKSMQGEEWQEIDGTSGKYLVSTCGRIKSYCGYNAILLKPYKKSNGYLIVKINGKNFALHRLVAFAFCENKYSD